MPELVIPDNEKAGVHKAGRYEPTLNLAYQELAAHYGTTVLPARPRAPQDRAKVEAAVQQVERRIMAPLRNHTFFSLDELRGEVAPPLAALNERPFQKTAGSRRSWFDELDRPTLKPLPSQRYEYAEWRKARVNITTTSRSITPSTASPIPCPATRSMSASAPTPSRSSTRAGGSLRTGASTRRADT